MPPKITVEILDRDLEKIAEVRALYPITESGMVLRYSKELSDYGTCTFRVATEDPLLTQYGDILIPHKYHIRIREGQAIVWQGAIIDNPRRTKNFVEILGAQYIFYLNKKRIRRDAEVVAGDGKNNYRLFKTGTMASAVSTIVTQAATDYGSQHLLGGMTVGTIDNPNYPSNFTNAVGAPLTGPWSFSDFIQLQFDYHSVYYVLKAFGVYGRTDFEITNSLVFNFKTFIGTDHRYDTTFKYGIQGNIVDYDLPRLGKRMTNDLMGIAADNKGVVLHASQRDEASIIEFGLMEDTSAFADVKSTNFLQSRLKEEIRLVSRPENAAVNIVVDEKSTVYGAYDIGDIVTVEVKDHVIDFKQARRIVGITTNIHNTGRKLCTIQTNTPIDNQFGAR